MTQGEKTSVETEASQSDIPTGTPPPTENEGQQEQQAANLRQPNTQSEACGLPSFSEEQVEPGRDVIVPKREDELIEELSFPETGHYSTESTQLVPTENYKIFGKILKKTGLWLCEVVRERFNRLFLSGIVACLSNVVGIFLNSGEYLDVGISISAIAMTYFTFTFVERGIYYSVVTEYMDKLCPNFAACCIERESPHRSSQFHRFNSDTRFEHEVADTSNPDEVPRIIFRNEETDISSSDHPESPKTVNVDVHGNVSISPDYTEGACGYSSPGHATCVYSSSDSTGYDYPCRGNTKSPQNVS